jgi:integrase
MRIKLTPAFVAKATCPHDREKFTYWDTQLRSFGLVVYRSGKKNFCIQYRHHRRSRTMKVDGVLSLEQARKQARALLGEVARGGDPLGQRRREQQAAANTFHSIAEEFFTREGRNLRSTAAWRAQLERCVFPVIGAVQIADLRRSDIVRLLDKIEDQRGPAAADTSLSVIRRILNWAATRSDEFRSPIVRGMRRTKPKERARARILSDAELAAVWKATGEMDGPFPAFIRLLLLTAARRNEVARMEWSELEGSIWTLPASRNKTKVDLVRPFSAAAQAVLTALPRFHNSRYVFSVSGRTALRGFHKQKVKLDRLSGTSGWQIHDLRRTARSLLSRAGVSSEVAERTLGHVLPGIQATYNRHRYVNEMALAYEKLAALIEQIVNPQKNILPLVRPQLADL